MECRYDMSMEEIYVSVRGLGVKDQLHMLINLTLTGVKSLEDQRNMFDVQDVDVTIRG